MQMSNKHEKSSAPLTVKNEMLYNFSLVKSLKALKQLEVLL